MSNLAPPEPTDHDQLFKEVIRTFFPDFLALFLPAQAEQYDLSAVTWTNPEVFADPPDGPRHLLDMVAELPKRDATGETALALIHVEIESADSVTDIERRLPAYYFHLRRTRRKRVLPVVLFLKVGLDGVGMRTVNDPPDDADPVMVFRYRYIGLPGLPAVDFLRGDNWLGVAMSALMGIPKGQRIGLGVEAMRRIGESPLADNHKALLGDCVETYIDLPEGELERFRNIINANATGGVQPVNKTRVQLAREEGEEEGDLRARRAMLAELLETWFGLLPDDMANRIATETDPESLRRWLRVAGTVDTFADFRTAVGW